MRFKFRSFVGVVALSLAGMSLWVGAASGKTVLLSDAVNQSNLPCLGFPCFYYPDIVGGTPGGTTHPVVGYRIGRGGPSDLPSLCVFTRSHTQSETDS